MLKTLLLPLVWTINDPDPAVRNAVGLGGYLVAPEQIRDERLRKDWEARQAQFRDAGLALVALAEVSPDTWEALLAYDAAETHRFRAMDRAFAIRLQIDGVRLGLLRESGGSFPRLAPDNVPLLDVMRARFRGEYPADSWRPRPRALRGPVFGVGLAGAVSAALRPFAVAIINDPDPAVGDVVGWLGYFPPSEAIQDELERAYWNVRRARLTDTLHRLRVFCEVAPDTWAALMAADATPWFRDRGKDRVFVERLYRDGHRLELLRETEKWRFDPKSGSIPGLPEMRERFRGQRHVGDDEDFFPLFSLAPAGRSAARSLPAPGGGWGRAPDPLGARPEPTINWKYTGTGFGDYADPTNWEGGAVPGKDDRIHLPTGTGHIKLVGEYKSISCGAAWDHSILIPDGKTLKVGGGSLDGSLNHNHHAYFTFESNTTLEIAGDMTLRATRFVNSGGWAGNNTVKVSGKLTLGDAADEIVEFHKTDLEVTGTGSLTLIGSADRTRGRIRAVGQVSVRNAGRITLSGTAPEIGGVGPVTVTNARTGEIVFSGADGVFVGQHINHGLVRLEGETATVGDPSGKTSGEFINRGTLVLELLTGKHSRLNIRGDRRDGRDAYTSIGGNTRAVGSGPGRLMTDPRSASIRASRARLSDGEIGCESCRGFGTLEFDLNADERLSLHGMTARLTYNSEHNGVDKIFANRGMTIGGRTAVHVAVTGADPSAGIFTLITSTGRTGEAVPGSTFPPDAAIGHEVNAVQMRVKRR